MRHLDGEPRLAFAVLLGEGLLASLALWCYRRRHGRGAGGGGPSSRCDARRRAELWERCRPEGVEWLLAGRVRRRACERRAAAAGWQVSAEPTVPRLSS